MVLRADDQHDPLVDQRFYFKLGFSRKAIKQGEIQPSLLELPNESTSVLALDFNRDTTIALVEDLSQSGEQVGVDAFVGADPEAALFELGQTLHRHNGFATKTDGRAGVRIDPPARRSQRIVPALRAIEEWRSDSLLQ